jgi:MinD superfamily P-loop ATPase
MVKQLTIISGKGGTGKTTIAAAIAYLVQDKAVLADVDVDAPDFHLILQPNITDEKALNISKKVKRDENKCIRCGICEKACNFDAITSYDIDYYKCEGCGLCVRLCPEDALELESVFSAKLLESETRFGSFVHAEMAIGEGNSGRIVDEVRKRASSIATDQEKDFMIIDGSPGIGCPVIASITGVDLVLIVVEPTLSGIHDLDRVLQVTQHFNIPAVVCLNKYDINLKNTEKIEQYCEEKEVQLVGKIPFSTIVPKSITNAKSIFEIENNDIVGDPIREMWKKIAKRL